MNTHNEKKRQTLPIPLHQQCIGHLNRCENPMMAAMRRPAGEVPALQVAPTSGPVVNRSRLVLSCVPMSKSWLSIYEVLFTTLQCTMARLAQGEGKKKKNLLSQTKECQEFFHHTPPLHCQFLTQTRQVPKQTPDWYGHKKGNWPVQEASLKD